MSREGWGGEEEERQEGKDKGGCRGDLKEEGQASGEEERQSREGEGGEGGRGRGGRGEEVCR